MCGAQYAIRLSLHTLTSGADAVPSLVGARSARIHAVHVCVQGARCGALGAPYSM